MLVEIKRASVVDGVYPGANKGFLRRECFRMIFQERESVSGLPCPPDAQRTATMNYGQVAFIRDEIALHLVRPTQDQRAVSLHLYSGPIPDCQIYCPSTGKIERRELCFHSIHGELQQG